MCKPQALRVIYFRAMVKFTHEAQLNAKLIVYYLRLVASQQVSNYSRVIFAASM